MANTTAILEEAAAELGRARLIFPPFNSPHEGYAVLLEEVNELWEEVKRKDRDSTALRKEAIQVAAMALRFVFDLTEPVAAEAHSGETDLS